MGGAAAQVRSWPLQRATARSDVLVLKLEVTHALDALPILICSAPLLQLVIKQRVTVFSSSLLLCSDRLALVWRRSIVPLRDAQSKVTHHIGMQASLNQSMHSRIRKRSVVLHSAQVCRLWVKMWL